jgi:outer membrane protein assembly complex protein YaeT
MRSIVVLLLLLAGAAPLAAQSQTPIVRGLKFEGNKALDDLTLSAAIGTTNSSAFARNGLVRWIGLGEKRYFNPTEFRRDVLRLQVIYRASGFPDVQVDTVVVRGEEDIKVTFKITEGDPIRVAAIRSEGLDSVADPERLMRDLPLDAGDIFSRFSVQATRDTMVERLWNVGFPTADVSAVWTVDSAARTAQVLFRAVPGQSAVFGPVSVTGMEEVDSTFIASLVTARPGRMYRREALFRSQRALYGTDLFRFASIGIDTTVFSPGDSVAPLRVNVLEGRAHRARGSVGFATNDCFRVGAGWTARNFLGNGRVVDVSGRLSKIGVGEPLGFGAEESICSQLKEDTVGSRLANYGLNVSLRRNAFLAPDNTLVLSLFSERRSEFAVFLREEIGAGIALTRETSRRIPVTLAYRISYGLTQANAASFCGFFNACLASDIAQLRQRRVLTTLSLSAVRQRVNNVLDPTRGSIMSAEATVSSRFLGSARLQQFVRVVADAALFVPLTRQIVFAGHLRGGAVVAPSIDLASGATNFIPPEQRFYAGGANDVRGYDRNELGPVVYVVPRDSLTTDPEGEVDFPASSARIAATGGNRVLIANAELRFPAPFLGDRFRLAAFVDAGTLWDGTGRPASVRFTPGVGVRIASPLGPLRLDVGYNPYQLERGSVFSADENGDLLLVREGFRVDRSRPYTVHFSVGQAF